MKKKVKKYLFGIIKKVKDKDTKSIYFCGIKIYSKRKHIMSGLLGFRSDVHSQFGEDGILEEILRILPENDNWCCEFGAWDGVYLSNTCNLIKNKNYKAVLIEADKNKFEELQVNLDGYEIYAYNKFVEFEGENTLDNILSSTEIPKNFDFLSIDIDGADYWVFESLLEYRPKVICIETNPTMGHLCKYVQPKSMSVSIGSSALATKLLGEEKGYKLVCKNNINLFFVDNKYADLFSVSDNLIEENTDYSMINTLFVGYDGTVHLDGPKKLYWHGHLAMNITIEEGLPEILRKYPPYYTKEESELFELYRSYIIRLNELNKTC